MKNKSLKKMEKFSEESYLHNLCIMSVSRRAGDYPKNMKLTDMDIKLTYRSEDDSFAEGDTPFHVVGVCEIKKVEIEPNNHYDDIWDDLDYESSDLGDAFKILFEKNEEGFAIPTAIGEASCSDFENDTFFLIHKLVIEDKYKKDGYGTFLIQNIFDLYKFDGAVILHSGVLTELITKQTSQKEINALNNISDKFWKSNGFLETSKNSAFFYLPEELRSPNKEEY